MKPKILLTFSALFSIPLAVLGYFLFKTLSPELQDLLPLSSPYLKSSELASQRVWPNDRLVLWIESENSELSLQFQKEISSKLKEGNIPYVHEVEYQVGPEAEFFSKRVGLFFTSEELQQFENKLTQKKAPIQKLFGDFKDLIGLKKWGTKFSGTLSRYTRFKDGYYGSPDGKIRIVILNVKDPAGALHLRPALEVQNKANSIIADTVTKNTLYQNVKVRFTGNLRHIIEDHESLYRDIEVTTLLVLLTVGLSLFLYFRSWRDLFYLSSSLTFGLLMCFGVAFFIFKPMNSNAAFMTSIVIGNGINFGILLLTRIRETGNIELSLKDVRNPTLLAMAGGIICYGSLAFTEFRGFQQFGLMGAIGTACCWIAAMLLIPAMIRLSEGDQIKQWAPTKKQTDQFNIETAKKISKIIFLILLPIIIAIPILHPSFRFEYETDLMKLRDEKSLNAGSLGLAAKLTEVMGQQLSPLAILTSSREQATRIANKIQSKGIVQNVIAINQLVPENQSQKLEALKKFNKNTSKILLDKLSLPEKTLLQALRASNNAKPFTEKDIPETVLSKFEEKNGERGRIIYIELKKSQLNNLQGIRNLMQDLKNITDPEDPEAIVVGTQALVLELCNAVEKESKKITLSVFLAILLMALLLFPNIQSSSWIVSSWMMALLTFAAYILYTRTKLNMINFLAIPITVGIGIDYAANLYARMKTESFISAVKAVALCSLTTCLGYLSLLAAGNEGLKSFARLSFVGELICVLLSAAWGLIFIVRRSSR